MRDLAGIALRWMAEARPAVLVRPVTEEGFGPRHPHDALLLDGRGDRGDRAGELYRGVFDAHFLAEVVRMPADGTSRICEVAVHGHEAAEAGLTCGGQTEVLLLPLAAIPQRWWSLLAGGRGAALITSPIEAGTRATSTVTTTADRTESATTTPPPPDTSAATWAATPAETALAVCGEILAALDSRTARPLRDTAGPINTVDTNP
ncbi:hypothetical protein [Embleya sp. NBC_00896]|uniref:hypothetical protein n=1 Tax=Embleya sp. NBC_00896 TaxID=2975961 RepID=UPI002F90F042|nr:hypothetical protein OG928_40925 [Embleya sp. NBC_00896]